MFQLLHLVSQNLQSIVEHGGYFFLFFSTIAEGVPIIGQFIPGHTVVIISGFLSKLGILNLAIVTVVVIFGAMIGDLIGFYLGRKYGFALLVKFGKYFFLKEEYIEKAKKTVSDHRFKAILLGRFSPLTRTLSPFMIGASSVDTRIFWLLDFISVSLWSIISVGIGYIFGSSYHVVTAVIGKYIFIFIIIGILVIWGYRFINKKFHVFAKYELITVALNIFGLYLFFKTIQDALTDKVFLLELDLYVNNFFFLHATDFWLNFMIYITNIFSPASITITSLIIISYLMYKKNYHYALIGFSSLSGGYLFTFIIKNIVMRVRPEDAFIAQAGYSFPSGHAVAATIFFTLLVYFFIVKVKSIHVREILIVISVFLLLLTAFSRVYLGVHWLSDVFAGIGLGLFLVTSVILILKYVSMIVKLFRETKEEDSFQS